MYRDAHVIESQCQRLTFPTNNTFWNRLREGR